MTFAPAPVTPTGPAPAPTQAPHRRSSRVLDLALAGAAVLAIGGVAFAAGRATAPATAAAFPPGASVIRPDGSLAPGAGGALGGPRFAIGGGLTMDGTVTALDADSITIQSDDGQEMTFELTASTAYHEASDATASDVAVGDDVSIRVAGDRQADGPGASGEPPSLSASDITVAR